MELMMKGRFRLCLTALALPLALAGAARASETAAEPATASAVLQERDGGCEMLLPAGASWQMARDGTSSVALDLRGETLDAPTGGGLCAPLVAVAPLAGEKGTRVT